MDKRLQSCFGDEQTLPHMCACVCTHTGHDHIRSVSLGNKAEEQAVLNS